MEYKISDLEGIDLEERVRHFLFYADDRFQPVENKVEVRDGEKIVLYRGRASELRMSWGRLTGIMNITRYDGREYIRRESRIRVWPPGLRKITTPVVEWDKSWESQAGEYRPGFFTGRSWCKGTYDFCELVSYKGELSDREESDHYRKRLTEEAKREGIILKPQLLEAVFDPIDEEILRIYKELRDSIYEKVKKESQ